MPPPGLPALGLLVLVLLIAWRLYSRVRHLVGRQRASRIRPWITLAVFPAFVLLFALLVHSGEQLAWLGAALVAGAGLGVYGLRRTSFEATPKGLFYTPNAHLGIALSALLAGRVLYRLGELYLAGHAAFFGGGFVRSAATLAIFGLVAGYYVTYAIGLVRWRRAALRRRQARQTSASA